MKMFTGYVYGNHMAKINLSFLTWPRIVLNQCFSSNSLKNNISRNNMKERSLSWTTSYRLPWFTSHAACLDLLSNTFVDMTHKRSSEPTWEREVVKLANGNKKGKWRIDVQNQCRRSAAAPRIGLQNLQLHQSFRQVCIQLGAIFNITINRIKKGTRESAIPNR